MPYPDPYYNIVDEHEVRFHHNIEHVPSVSVRAKEIMSEKFKKILPLQENVLPIRFLILDIDGVMTDGTITYTSSGEELKSFDVKDGQGLKFWERAGYAAGVITGRSSPIVERRARELGIAFVEMGAKFKLPAFEKMIAEAGVRPEEVAMIGDDLPDYPLIIRAGLGVAVADAVEEVKEAAAMVTEKPGGRGAVREVVDFILKSQGRWEAVMERYLKA